jgi:hypothetical protein
MALAMLVRKCMRSVAWAERLSSFSDSAVVMPVTGFFLYERDIACSLQRFDVCCYPYREKVLLFLAGALHRAKEKSLREGAQGLSEK